MDTKLLGLILQGDKRIAREITELKNTLSDAGLTESGAIVQTAAGESIVANDTSDDGLKGLRVFGKSEQTTYSGKNLFNPANVLPNIYCFASDTSLGASDNAYSVYAACEPNTTYTVSKLLGARFTVAYTEDQPKDYCPIYGVYQDNAATSLTITTGATAKYIVAFVHNSNHDTISLEEMLASIQIEKGSTATSYESYTGGIPIPNPNFPQPINSAGADGGIEVGVYGGNLCGAFEQGTLDGSTGKLISTSVEIRCANFIPVVSNKEMYIKRTTIGGSIKLRFYDGNFNYIGGGDNKFYTLILGSNIGNPMLSKDDFCIIKVTDERIKYFKIVDTANDLSTKYFVGYYDGLCEEPYYKQSLPIPTPNGLPGIPVTNASLATYTDAEGQMWCADEVDFERGVYVKRIGKMLLDKPSQFKTEIESHKRVYVQNNNIYNVGPARQKCILCDGLTVDTVDRDYICFQYVNAIYCYVGCTTYAEFEDFISNNPLTVQYILATPIETPLSDSELEAYKKLHTNYPVTTILNDSGAHMELTYNADTKNYIDNKFTELTNAILSMGGNV